MHGASHCTPRLRLRPSHSPPRGYPRHHAPFVWVWQEPSVDTSGFYGQPHVHATSAPWLAETRYLMERVWRALFLNPQLIKGRRGIFKPGNSPKNILGSLWARCTSKEENLRSVSKNSHKGALTPTHKNMSLHPPTDPGKKICLANYPVD